MKTKSVNSYKIYQKSRLRCIFFCKTRKKQKKNILEPHKTASLHKMTLSGCRDRNGLSLDRPDGRHRSSANCSSFSYVN